MTPVCIPDPALASRAAADDPVAADADADADAVVVTVTAAVVAFTDKAPALEAPGCKQPSME